MKETIVALAGFALLGATLEAKPFEEAQVTETINLVSLLRQLQKPQPATIGDVIKGQTALRTGGDSRAEMKFPDLTITRVGSNSLFRFYAGGRDMTLDGGTMLFYSPKGTGGGKVQAGAVTAAVTGSAIMVMNVPPLIKVACLQHSAVVSGNGWVRTIRANQVVDQDGKVVNFTLNPETSALLTGFTTSLPFAIREYRQGIIRNLDTDTANDQIAQITRRTIAANQPPQIVQTSSAPTTQNQLPQNQLPQSQLSQNQLPPPNQPTVAPTPNRRPHHLPVKKIIRWLRKHHGGGGGGEGGGGQGEGTVSKRGGR